MATARASMLSGRVAPTVLKFILPILAANVIQQLYTTTDRIIVGRFVSKEGLAAVGASFPIIFLLAIMLMGVFTGSTVLLGHALGAKQEQRVREIVDTTYFLSFVLSLAVTVIGLLISDPLLRLLRVPEQIHSQATIYLRIIFIGFPGMVCYYGTSSLARAVGDSKTPLFFFSLAAVGNVIFDLLFVIVFGWGVAGSAWATILMQSLAGVAQLLYLKHKGGGLELRLTALRWRPETAGQIMKLGSASAVQQMMVALNVLILQYFINGYGVTVVAGFVAGSQVDTYGRMVMLSTMIGLAPFVSQNLGGGQERRAKRGLLVALIFNLTVSVVLFTLILFWGENVVSLFNADPGMVSVGAQFLTVSSGFYWLISLQFCIVGFLRGSGAVILPALTSVCATLLLPVFAVFYSRHFGYLGLFYCLPSIWFLQATTFFIYFWSGRWRGKMKSHA